MGVLHNLGQVGGHVLNAAPGYSTLGANITNPYVNYKGVSNPADPNRTAPLLFPNAGTGATQQADPGAGSGAYAGSDGAQAASDAETKAQNAAYLDDQEGQLNGLLGRVDTGLTQGLDKLNSDYQNSVNQQGTLHNQANSDYQDKRVATTKDRQNNYETINKGANTGYRSLAQIVGRNSGTGGTFFNQLLPNVIGRDVSGKRTAANETFATNQGNIDTAQKKTDLSFENILSDLARQRQSGEGDVRSGIEGQRQALLEQIKGVRTQRVQNDGGGYEAVRAAQAPLNAQLNSSRDNVSRFFDQFKPGVQAQQAAVAQADIGQYTADRSNINAQNAGGNVTDNPYSELLKKRLQEAASPLAPTEQPVA